MSTGYGRDIWCTDAMATGRLARGSQVVLQALYRRLITPRGTLRGGEEELAYGFDIAEYVGAVGITTAVAALPGIVRAELLKDDRVLSVSVDASIVTDTPGLTSITLALLVTLDDELADFPLTLAVTDVDVTLIGGISEAA